VVPYFNLEGSVWCLLGEIAESGQLDGKLEDLQSCTIWKKSKCLCWGWTPAVQFWPNCHNCLQLLQLHHI